ncbi:kelch domain-containing protein [Plectosphaerella cucumerina]|uniref:Kelch domain-containing protein n=1 Tax=Plectosphaerella cucumerina TaxID=40658 RepID=A0A8K0WZ73_9PEZI|nr:kelch domain-containing protein [Plectosphaerella cucumerina]
MNGNIKKGRKSIFREVGLDDDSDEGDNETAVQPQSRQPRQPSIDEKEFEDVPAGLASERNTDEEVDRDHGQFENDDGNAHDEPRDAGRSPQPARGASLRTNKAPWYSKLGARRPRIRASRSSPGAPVSGIHRITMLAFIVAVVFPGITFRKGDGQVDIGSADAGLIRTREESRTDVCTRWAHQGKSMKDEMHIAQVNGTLYIYGGQAKTEASQELNTWNNYFLSLNLQESWDIDEPSLTGLTIPDGPPAVSLGYLWQDYSNLYLYGGQFADNDGGEQVYATPDEMALWRYSISGKQWTSFRDPETSAGNYSTEGGLRVQRAAEGAGLSVPELGLSWYFGGHLDTATTKDWSIHVPRIYLSSLLEWTHPGYGNNGVTSLRDSGAGEGGAYRNITQGGTQQDVAEFPLRADAVLIFVPGWGAKGVLIGLGGGADEDLTENMETLDVFDVDTSEWYHQETTGDKPPNRVNPCAVIASAPDASSFQIYLFGGQDLPFGNQTQYNDMYILSIPAFHWIRVDKSDDSNIPYPRAGHTCTMRDGQIIMVGGYVGEDIDCDSPGIYVFNATSLRWTDGFRAGDHNPDLSPGNSVLAGSWGYQVPEPVQRVIGGDANGGATVSTPASGPATGGPFATGVPPVFTITQGGPTATVTQAAPGRSGGAGAAAEEKRGPNAGLVAAGVIAGLLGVLAAYLGFCAWLYRRQVSAYKRHLAVANRYSGASNASFGMFGGLLGRSHTQRSGRAGGGKHRRDHSNGSEDEYFGWVGAGVEPKWATDKPSPGSGSANTAVGGGSMMRRSDDVRSGYTGGEGSRDTDQGSISSTEQLLDGQEPSFFSVVIGPRRALRVVNGMEEGHEQH